MKIQDFSAMKSIIEAYPATLHSFFAECRSIQRSSCILYHHPPCPRFHFTYLSLWLVRSHLDSDKGVASVIVFSNTARCRKNLGASVGNIFFPRVMFRFRLTY